ncbi:MAG: bifunctional adenosylcobinamide kinase/adenosylcobinamide-phosphate guanylyltransferase [Mycobacterium leprae]
MDLTLLGTGAAEGWPDPFCACASCARMRRRGGVRAPTGALLDAAVLVDCGPEALGAAARLGLDLSGVRHLLLSHAHGGWDAVPRWRSWAGGGEALDVVAPPSVVAALRERAGPGDAVTFRSVGPGDVVDVAGHRVRALATSAADRVLYDLAARGGGRLLYATSTGPLPEATVEAVRGAAYDVVLLAEMFGDLPAPRDAGLNLTTFPAQLARLRGAGAITDSTQVVAVCLGHHNPPPDELARRLAPWGARVLPDGARLRVGAPDGSTPSPPAHRVLVLGGARSGKSAEAERRLAAEPAVTYVATAREPPGDEEWRERVAAHRARRPRCWRTVETGDLERLLTAPPDTAPILVDCLTLWLADTLERAADPDGRVAGLVEAWRTTPVRVLAVSNEVGSGVVPVSATGRRFRDLLGTLNARIAAHSDEVWLVTAGIPRRLR